jgi:2-(1,2-epoxy-1,2-dihydrophenyl)acetyl-CoA isomerase
MSQTEFVQCTIENQIAVVTLNRPDNANALNLAMAQQLLETVLLLRENSNVRAVIVTGQGAMFCAGGDLASFADMGDAVSVGLRQITTALHAAIATINRMDAPVIMAINGSAAGAGFSLAIAGDFAIAAQSARFTMAYTAAGLSPDGSSSYFLPRRVGIMRARELMMTNRRLSAEQALDWGLVNQVEADEALMVSAMQLAGTLAKGPTKAFGQVKKLLNSSFDSGLETQMQYEADSIAAMASTADGAEGVSAFLEKRKAVFSGR